MYTFFLFSFSLSSTLYSYDKIFPDLFLISVPQPSTFKIAEIEKKKGKSMAFSSESFNISQYYRVYQKKKNTSTFIPSKRYLNAM